MRSREWTRQRQEERRAYALKRLGGKCVVCGVTEDLHFDHVDKTTKRYNVTEMLWWASLENLDMELANCQLLCQAHHIEKTRVAWDYAQPQVGHGTYWRYRKYKCRCPDCVTANREQLRRWKFKPT